MDDHTAQQPSSSPTVESFLGEQDGGMEIAYYPERMARSGEPVALSPSQAVRYTEDPDLLAAAAATAGSRQVTQPADLPPLTELWECETAPLPPLVGADADGLPDDPFAFAAFPDEPVPAPSLRAGGGWAGLFGAAAEDDLDTSEGDTAVGWKPTPLSAAHARGGAATEESEGLGDRDLEDRQDREDLEAPASGGRRRRGRGMRRSRAPRSRTTSRRRVGRDGAADHRAALPWWEAAQPASGGIWSRLRRR
jgi:hypothetical protein